jgi:hypothetical protein
VSENNNNQIDGVRRALLKMCWAELSEKWTSFSLARVCVRNRSTKYHDVFSISQRFGERAVERHTMARLTPIHTFICSRTLSRSYLMSRLPSTVTYKSHLMMMIMMNDLIVLYHVNQAAGPLSVGCSFRGGGTRDYTTLVAGSKNKIFSPLFAFISIEREPL